MIMRLPVDSLRFRFIAAMFVWVTVGLTLTGITVALLMKVYIKQQFHDELSIHVEELVALTSVNAAGQPYLNRPLSDPRYILPGSGYYWEVHRDGFAPMRSPSLGQDHLSLVPAATFAKQWQMTEGPTGRTIEYGMTRQVSDHGPPIRFSLSTDVSELTSVLRQFNWPLAIALAILAGLMLLAGLVLVPFGLKPLHQLEQAIADVRTGRKTVMAGQFPQEVKPLVHDVNALLESNAAMILRARTQAGNLAHGLRTPLTIMFDEVDHLTNDNAADGALALRRECDRMKRQIDYHLARTRVATAIPSPGQAASITETLAPILTAMKQLHGRDGKTICCGDFPDQLVACETIDLAEMLSNLLDNGCKWARQRVFVSWAVDDNAIQIMVDDDGPGIPPEKYADVFNIGTRLDRTTPGSGLGLAIVRDLVQLYGGTIALGKSPLRGLRATITVPIVNAR